MITDGEGDAFDLDSLIDPKTPRALRLLPSLLSHALQLVWRAARRELIATFALQVLSSATIVGQLLVARQLLDRLIDGTTAHDFSAATPSVLLLIGLLAVSGLSSVLRTELSRLLCELVAWHSMRQVISAAVAADLSEFENPTFHDRLQRSIINAAIRPIQMTNGLVSVGTSLFGVAAVAFTLVFIEPLFLPLGILAVVPITLVSLRVGRALYQFAVAMTPTDRQRMYVQTLLTEKDPAKEVRAYDLGPYLEQRFNELYAKRLTALRKLVRSRIVQGVAGSLLTAAVSGGTLALLIVLVATGHVSLAGAGAAAAALLLLSNQLQSLASGVGQLYESSLFIADFHDFVGPQTVSSLPVTPMSDGVTPAGPTPAPTIVLRDVTFTYPSRTEPSVAGINMEIPAGQVIALVGENGSGKTTLAKLVAGLYPLTEGTIAWDGIDARQLPVSEQRRRTAVLFADFVRYFFTVGENIGVGAWERSGDAAAVAAAASNAGAEGIIEALRSRYDTYLGPQFFGGSDLSGGQWQRIALARAFFRDAGLIILDEPTAALDPRAEAALFESVRQLFADRSVLLISHRFMSVRMADHIYVLDQGRMVEDGNHDELLRRGGLYAELFELQAAAFRHGDDLYRRT